MGLAALFFRPQAFNRFSDKQFSCAVVADIFWENEHILGKLSFQLVSLIISCSRDTAVEDDDSIFCSMYNHMSIRRAH